MAIPERETTLRIINDGLTNETNAIELSPSSFSVEALKEIARSQIFADEPKSMLVENHYSTSYWSSSFLRGIRFNYRGIHRLGKLQMLAREMKRADRITFEASSSCEA